MFDKVKYIREYMREYRKTHPDLDKKHRPRYNQKFNPMRIKYKGKQIYVKQNPRSGVCSQCNKEGYTQMHHFAEYHDDDPLKDTIELCASCHRRRHLTK